MIIFGSTYIHLCALKESTLEFNLEFSDGQDIKSVKTDLSVTH